MRNSNELQGLISELGESSAVIDSKFEFETGDGWHAVTSSLDGTLIVTGLSAQEVLRAIDYDDTQFKIGALRNLAIDMICLVDRALSGSFNRADMLRDANTLRHRAYTLGCEVMDAVGVGDE